MSQATYQYALPLSDILGLLTLQIHFSGQGYYNRGRRETLLSQKMEQFRLFPNFYFSLKHLKTFL